jgi:hypothetical protein
MEVFMKKILYYSLIIFLFVGLAACAESSPSTPTPPTTPTPTPTPAPSSTLTPINAPSNLRIEGGTVAWDNVTGADGYIVSFGNLSLPTQSNSIYLFDYVEQLLIGSNVVRVVSTAGSNRSEASNITFNFNFESPRNLVIIDEVLRWDTSEFADSYIVSIGNSSISVTDNELDFSEKLDNFVIGTNEISVVAVINTFRSSASIIEYYRELLAPTNLLIKDNILNWDESNLAQEYIVTIGESSITVQNNSLNLIDHLSKLSIGDNEITITAVSGNESSTSSSIIFKWILQSPQNVSIESTTTSVEVKWDTVPGASSYIITFNGGFEQRTTNTRLSISRSTIMANEILTTATNILVYAIDANNNQSSPSKNAQLVTNLISTNLIFEYGPSNSHRATLKWEAVPNAVFYTISAGGKSINRTGTSIEIKDLEIEPGLYNFSITPKILGHSGPTTSITEFFGFVITTPELPVRICTDCNSTSNAKLYELTSINSDFDGTLTVRFFFSGTLIDSLRGPTTSVSGRISYRIIDSNGNIVRSTSFSIPSLFPGEGFLNVRETWFPYQSDIPFGTYRIDIILIQN